MRKNVIAALAGMSLLVLAGVANADQPVKLTDAQMDGIAAAGWTDWLNYSFLAGASPQHDDDTATGDAGTATAMAWAFSTSASPTCCIAVGGASASDGWFHSFSFSSSTASSTE